MSEIKALLQQIVGIDKLPPQVMVGKVTDIDKSEATCTVEPLNGFAALYNVNLKAVIDGNNNGLIVYPAKGSFVYVAIVENNPLNAFVCLVTEVESFRLTIGNNTIDGDNNGININWQQVTINGGNNHGLMNIAPSVAAFNALQKDVNELKSIITAWTPVPQDGGAALKTATSTWAGTQLNITQQSDLEDTKIKH